MALEINFQENDYVHRRSKEKPFVSKLYMFIHFLTFLDPCFF